MPISRHAKDPKHQARMSAFGLTANQVAAQMSQMPRLNNDAVVLASSDRKVRVGGATGKHLVAICRNGEVRTVLIADKLCPRKLRVSKIR